MKTVIVIPARYGSKRLPGKPLAKIADKTLLQRVVQIAKQVSEGRKDVGVVVATDDERIGKHCDELYVDWVKTSQECPTGTDRVEDAVQQLKYNPEFVLNLQGDSPFTPPDFVQALIESFYKKSVDVVTPVTQLSWEQLDQLRSNKNETPFSGTCVTFDSVTERAFWFSKNVFPAIRQEVALRKQNVLSPIFRHIGLYGFSRTMLKNFVSLPEGRFEKLEGLEQLRILENGYEIRCVQVDYRGRPSMSGIDSPEDIARAEKLYREHPEL